MSIFHHDAEPISAEFGGLVLADDVLQTPVGPMPVGELTRAEFLRTFEEGRQAGPEETSVPAVVGGAVVGGVVAGPVGAVVGGLAGSTVKEEGPAPVRDSSVQLIFETAALKYEMPIAHDDEEAAYSFTEHVKKAMKHHKN